MVDKVKTKVKFLNGYQLKLMIGAIKGRDLPGDSLVNNYNTKRSGEEYEAWLGIERVGLASKREFNEYLWSFKLTREGLEVAQYLIQQSDEEQELF